MAKIHTDKKSFDGLYDKIMKNNNHDHQLILTKKYPKIKEIFLFYKLVPTQAEIIICDYIDDPIVMDCSLGFTEYNTSNNMKEIIIRVVFYSTDIYINFSRYDFHFFLEISIFDKKELNTYELLDDGTGSKRCDPDNIIIKCSNDNELAEFDIINMFDVYRKLYYNKYNISSRNKQFVNQHNYTYNHNVIKCINNNEYYTIKIKNHRKFTNLIVIMSLISETIWKNFHNYPFERLKKDMTFTRKN